MPELFDTEMKPEASAQVENGVSACNPMRLQRNTVDVSRGGVARSAGGWSGERAKGGPHSTLNPSAIVQQIRR